MVQSDVHAIQLQSRDSLNPCGNRIGSLIQKPVEVGKVRDILLKEFDIDTETCEKDLVLLLSDLNNEGLIVLEYPTPS